MQLFFSSWLSPLLKAFRQVTKVRMGSITRPETRSLTSSLTSSITRSITTALTKILVLATMVGAFVLPSLPAYGSNLEISSQSQELQQLSPSNSKMIFKGSVVAHYDVSLVLKAQQVDVYNNAGATKVVAYGSPVEITDKVRNLYIRGKEVTFNVQKNEFVITNAFVRYQGNQLESATITYNLKTNNMFAEGSKNSRVKTTIINLNPGKK